MLGKVKEKYFKDEAEEALAAAASLESATPVDAAAGGPATVAAGAGGSDASVLGAMRELQMGGALAQAQAEDAKREAQAKADEAEAGRQRVRRGYLETLASFLPLDGDELQVAGGRR